MEDSKANGIDVPLDVILRLGLDKFNVEAQGSTPRQLLVLLSSALERSIRMNERSLEMARRKDGVTIFHSSRPPGLSIRQYLQRIFKYSPCSPSCFVAAQIYIDRFTQRTQSRLTLLNGHRLLITSVMVAAKFMDKVSHSNAYYAEVGGVSTEEMNQLEMNFLFAIDFRLHVSSEVFTGYCKQLEKEVYSADSSIKARRNVKSMVGRTVTGPGRRATRICVCWWPPRRLP